MSLVDKAAVKALLQPMTGFGLGSVVWAHDPEPMISPVDQAIVKLQLLHVARYGVDDTGASGGSNTIETSVTGLRGFTVQIRVDCYALDAEAQEITDAIRTQLQAPWTTTALDLLNYSLVDVMDSTDLGADVDNRVISSATMDVVFGAKSYASRVQTGTGWIDRINTHDDVLLKVEPLVTQQTIVSVQILGPRCAVILGG